MLELVLANCKGTFWHNPPLWMHELSPNWTTRGIGRWGWQSEAACGAFGDKTVAGSTVYRDLDGLNPDFPYYSHDLACLGVMGLLPQKLKAKKGAFRPCVHALVADGRFLFLLFFFGPNENT